MSDRAYLARIVVPVFVSTIVLLTMPVLLAQEVPAAAVLFPNFSEPGFTFSKRVDEVQLIFTVTDKRGHFIDKLGVDDFRLFDNEMPPEHLYNFEQRTNLPLQVVLLIDISSSVQVRFKFEQKAAATFLKKILQPGRDTAAVIAFGSTVRPIQGMTDNAADLQSAIHGLRPYGDTALYDALILAAHSFTTQPNAPRTRKVIVVLSDGNDTISKARAEEAITAVERAEASVVVVDSSFLDLAELRRDEKSFIERLTRMSGGFVIRAESNDGMTGAFRRIERGLRTQYALSYKPARMESDVAYRSIRILPQKSKWVVHCRSGYYAKRR
ncbi:MAG TPA: VWA domain-containing protein [Terriglobales bacterium]|jgi:Ca-activated chloride channel homolog|nr:VWA domain-containing protein [Terriglobales bacterium]